MKLLKISAYSMFVLLFMACGGSDSNQKSTQELQHYEPQIGNVHLRGSFADAGDLEFTLLSPNRKDTVSSFRAPAGELDQRLEGIMTDEVYMLEIAGQNMDDRGAALKWWYTLPVFLEDGAELQLVAEPIADAQPWDNPFDFSVEGAGAEQSFLQSWYGAYNRTADQGGISHSAQIDQEFIQKGEPLVSTMFLISEQRDHRSKVDQYQAIYDQAPDHVKQSKYGVDLANRIYRIHNPTSEIDVEKLFASRTSRLLPFDINDYSDKKHLLVIFWASWEPAASQIPAVREMVEQANKEDLEVLYFSLDTKVSEWKPVTDEWKLENSFMIRVEARQEAINQLYLTELPRYMVITPAGQVVENDVAYDDLEGVIQSL